MTPAAQGRRLHRLVRSVDAADRVRLGVGVPWDWSSSDWAGLTFLVVAAGVFLGLRQIAEARRLREEQARPFVIIDFRPLDLYMGVDVRNVGMTLAYDVRFDFSPKPTTTLDGRARGPFAELNLFMYPIPSLAPGKLITVLFDHFANHIEAELPMTYNVEVSYRDLAGKRYSETNVLDLSMYEDTGGITRREIHDVHQRLEQIAKAVGKWTDSDGLRVNTRTDRLQKAADVRAEREAIAAQREQTPPGETTDGPEEQGDGPSA